MMTISPTLNVLFFILFLLIRAVLGSTFELSYLGVVCASPFLFELVAADSALRSEVF